MVLVKPATVIQWHRQGFRLFLRWRSRSGRPSVERELRDLIRQMSSANSLRGAPRIHGELLKLGIETSQATVAKYMVRRRGTPPSQNWRIFLRNLFWSELLFVVHLMAAVERLRGNPFTPILEPHGRNARRICSSVCPFLATVLSSSWLSRRPRTTDETQLIAGWTFGFWVRPSPARKVAAVMV
jgi:hypothetical protein